MKSIILPCWLTLFICLTFSSVEAHPGIGIVQDSKGSVYYTDLVHVWKISPDGRPSIAVENVHTHELYIDASDNLYGEHEYYKGEEADKWGNYVWRLTAEGKFEIMIPEIEGFLDNDTLVRDELGNSFWSKNINDHQQIIKQSVDGSYCTFSEHEFADIRWLHYSQPHNALFVVDGLLVKKISSSGEVEIIASDLKGSGRPFNGVSDRHYIFGLWSGNNSDIYIAVYGDKKVKRIDNKGNLETVFESSFGWSPCGGMIAADGSLWIMEFSRMNNTRVKKIDRDGTQTVFRN